MVKSKFKFIDQRIDKIDFWVNDESTNDPIDVAMSLTKKALRNPKDQQAIVTLEIKIFDNAKENNYPFYLNVSVSGIFGVNEEMDDEHFERFSNVNAVGVLFPYLRSAVTCITALSGLNTLILPLMNVVAMFEKEQSHK